MRKKRTVLLLVLLICLAAAGIMILIGERRKADAYQEALRLAESSDLQGAWRLFSDLGDYRDVPARKEALLGQDPALACRDAGKGDVVRFGRWEQDNDSENGPESVEWLVLDRVDGQLLLLSLYCLDGRAYHDVPFAEVTWEDSEMRAWLNGEFMQKAFTEAEQKFIPTVRNRNEDQSAVGTEGGSSTSDRVFLLSETDTVIYLNNDEARDSIGKAQVTEYTRNHHVEVTSDGYASWWLRSPGVYPYSAQFVDQEGLLHLSGAYIDIDYQFGVRPAVWLDVR